MPSTSSRQHRFFNAIAHSPEFAKKVGVKQSVGKDFVAADKKAGKYANGGSIAGHKRGKSMGMVDGGEVEKPSVAGFLRYLAAGKKLPGGIDEPANGQLADATAAPDTSQAATSLVSAPMAGLLTRHLDEANKYADGGKIDNIPIMATKGEYMLPVDTAKAVGKKNLDKLVKATHKPIRKAGIRHMADGGPIETEAERIKRLAAAGDTAGAAGALTAAAAKNVGANISSAGGAVVDAAKSGVESLMNATKPISRFRAGIYGQDFNAPASNTATVATPPASRAAPVAAPVIAAPAAAKMAGIDVNAPQAEPGGYTGEGFTGVPYKPIQRTVNPDGSIAITGSGQSPAYTERQAISASTPSAGINVPQQTRQGQLPVLDTTTPNTNVFEAMGKLGGDMNAYRNTAVGNRQNQVDFNNTLKAGQFGLSQQAEARAGKTAGIQNEIGQTTLADRKELADLAKEYSSVGTSLERKREIRTLILAKHGKDIRQQKFQLAVEKGIDPATGMPTQTNVVVDENTGVGRPLMAKAPPAPVKGEKSTVGGRSAIWNGTKWVPQ